jgi:hypothetical protein
MKSEFCFHYEMGGERERRHKEQWGLGFRVLKCLDEKSILFHLWKGKVELDVRGLWDEK